MKRIVGYTDKLSVETGDRIDFKVSVSDEIPNYNARIIRLIHGDDNPDGPGFQYEEIKASCNDTYKGIQQDDYSGSYIIIPDTTAFKYVNELSIAAMVYPTLLGIANQIIIHRVSESKNHGFILLINKDSKLVLRTWDNRGVVHEFINDTHIENNSWYFVGAIINECCDINTFVIKQSNLFKQNYGAVSDHNTDRVKLKWNCEDYPAIYMAGISIDAKYAINNDLGFFNGKLDKVRLFRKAESIESLCAIITDMIPAYKITSILSLWDFSLDIATDKITDLSPNNMHGYTVNLPARAVKGCSWDGSAQNWKCAPSHYSAIHFHEDDLYDLGWETSFSWEIGINIKSGIYAAEISYEDASEYIVFFIRPQRGAPKSDCVLLIPTASYIAYGNEHMAFNSPLIQLNTGRLSILDETDITLNENRNLGLSCYDTHSDGSGVFYSSRLRPLLNMRPKHGGILGGHGSSVWQFNADTHITAWLEYFNYNYDVITDEDLHQEGQSILHDYKVVLTGTHPEYYSTRMWNALFYYINNGGHLMYLGGNGFYWRIAFSDAYPGAIELRRAEDGTRTWASEPGEYYHSFNGEYGGLWRRLGRPPQMLVGVGFIAQGFDISSSYKREEISYDSSVRFIFEGVTDDIIGDFGLVGGGAAGLELDHTDSELGTPLNTKVLASSSEHSNIYQIVTEELSTNHPMTSGIDNEYVRAQLVYIETEHNGGVFSVGSIAWCGSLSYDEYDNSVSNITKNVLDHFLKHDL